MASYQMMKRTAVLLLLGAVLGTTGALAAAEKPSQARKLSLEAQTRKGDFDRMLEVRVIRMVVPYSRSLYYVDQGRERGLTAEFARDFERYLNKKYAKQLGKRQRKGARSRTEIGPTAARLGHSITK